MISRSAILISLLVGLLCIQFSYVRSGPLSNPEPEDDKKPSSLRKNEDRDDTESLELIIKAFSNILLSKIENNEVLTSLFLKPVYKDLGVYMAAAISESLVLEVGLSDSYSSRNLIINALLNVNPNAGPKTYCTTLVNIIAKILLHNEILSFKNYFTLANTVNRIILKAASDSLNKLRNGNKIRKNATTDLDIVTRNDVGIDAAAGLDIKANTGLDAATNIGIGLGADVGGNVGFDDANLDLRNNIGLNTNANLNANAGINPALGVDASVSLPPVTNLNPTVDAGVNTDLKLLEEANLIFKSELTNALLKDRNFRYVFSDCVPSNALKSIAAAICQYISKAFAISRSFLLPLENSIGNLSIDSTPSPEQYASIITGMLTNLFSQATFITKGTASLQATIASNAITSGIANFISISTISGAGLNINENAFNSYFSILSGLEKLPYVGVEAASSKLPLSIKLTYASMYASQFVKILYSNLLSSNKFLEAFSLGVPTFNNKIIAKSLGNFVAEAFGSPNSNLFYDLYSKALLIPTININSINYAKILSSATARALYLSGYFLSGNINIQAAIAKNAITRALTSTLRPLSTQVVLFPNILGLSWITQLEEASPNQILLKYGTDVGLNVGASSGFGLGLDGSANAKLNPALGVGVNANTALGTGINVNSGLGADLGVNVGLGGGSGTSIGLDGGLGANVGLGGGLGANVGLGGGLGANIGLGGGLDVNAGLGNGLNANIDLGRGLGTNVGLGSGLTTNSGLGTALGLNAGFGRVAGANIDLGAGVGANFGLGGNTGLGSTISGLNTGNVINTDLGTGLGVNVGLGGSLATDAGLGKGLDANFGLVKGLSTNANLGGIGTNVGLGGGLYGNIGSIGGLGANAGLGAGLGANAGLGAGLGANVGLGGVQNANIGLGTGLGINAGLGAATGVNSNFGTNIGINAGLGSGLGMNTGLGTNLNANGGLGTNFGLGGNANLGGGLMFQGTDATQGRIQDGQHSRKKRSTDDLDTLGTVPGNGAEVPIAAGAGFGLNSETVLGANVGLGAVLDTNVGLGGGLNANYGLGTGLGINAGLGTGLDINAGLGTGLGINAGLGTGVGINAGLGTGLGINAGLGTGLGINAGLGTGLGINAGLGTAAGLNTGLGTITGVHSNLGSNLDVNAGLGTGLGVGQAGLLISDNAGLFRSQTADQSTGIGADINTNLGVGTNFNTAINPGIPLGLNAVTNVGLQSTETGSSSNTQLSVLNVLPLILANKLYQSTALYTSVSMVGVRKIINLVSQAMASEFGLSIASVFLRSYSQFYVNNSDKSFEISVVGLAKATTEALAGTGFLNYKISVSTANQLADAIVSKFSSLIATSLEAKDCATAPQWSNLPSQDLAQQPLIPGYNTYPNNLQNSLMK